MRYHVEIADTDSRWAERTSTGVHADGEERTAELTVLGPDDYQLTLDGVSHRVFARRTEGGWRLTIRGRPIGVRIENERAHTIREMVGQGAVDVGPRELKAPMPGLVLRVLVEPGQPVAAGDGLIVVEAMKMENELRAEVAGTVSTITVEPGAAVDRDDVLVTFQADT